MITLPKELIGFIYYWPEIFRRMRNFEKFPGKLKKFPGSLGYPDYPLLKDKHILIGLNMGDDLYIEGYGI